MVTMIGLALAYPTSVVLGYMLGVFFYQYDLRNADFILYNLMPFGISLDTLYLTFQVFNNPEAEAVAVSQSLTLAQCEAQRLYTQLLPTLGYDFLSQYIELEPELLLFYNLQCVDFNIDLDLELFLTNASLNSLGTLVSLPFSSNRKQKFFSSIKLKNRVENLVYTENVRTNFLSFYLKMVKILPFLKLRHLLKVRPTHNSSAGFKVTVNIGKNLFCLGIVHYILIFGLMYNLFYSFLFQFFDLFYFIFLRLCLRVCLRVCIRLCLTFPPFSGTFAFSFLFNCKCKSR